MIAGRFKNFVSLARNIYHLSRQQPQSVLKPLREPYLSVLPAIRSQHQSVVEETDEVELRETKNVIAKVNNEIHTKSYGRLFAVVQVCGKQFKITDEDIIVIQGYWAPSAGDNIRLEKVLLVGSANFTLVGRPLLPKDQVSVYATVIEKTYTPTLLWYYKIPKKRHTKLKLFKIQQTILRITSINLLAGVNEVDDVDGLKDRIF